MAQVLTAEQKKPEAAAHFERAAELRPDFPEALIAVAKLRSDAKRYPDAIALLERAVKLQPRNETAHYNLMMAYRNAGQAGRCAAGKSRARQIAEASGRRVHGFPETAGRQEVRKALALLCAGIAAAQNPDFRNVAQQAGLTAPIPNGGSASKQFIVETTGSGVAFIDYDNDGLADIFIASGPGSPSRMYHNEGGGKFRDVTESLGFTREGWAQGVCAGDYDNDGYTDLFVTYWGQNALYRNVGGQRFEDVTAKVHLTQDRVRYNTGCAFIDYDNDGKLDLFVANYLKFDFDTTPKPGANPYCFYRGIAVNCGPRGLPFDRNILYHNEGGVFRDVSDESGISKPDGNYSLGVLTGDFNGDGLTDIYVACDQTPSILYINQGNGKFVDEALIRGAALDDNGKALSGMGVAAADYLHEGIPSIFRTNFSDELETLYRNQGKGEFQDVSVEAGLGRNTRFVGWGCGFFDFDNDGWPDLLLVNGHAFPEVDRLKIDIHYRERAILYRNDHGKFVDISESAGPGHSWKGIPRAGWLLRTTTTMDRLKRW